MFIRIYAQPWECDIDVCVGVCVCGWVWVWVCLGVGVYKNNEVNIRKGTEDEADVVF